MAQSSLSLSSRIIDEKTTPTLSFELQDKDGNQISKADLTSLTLTLWDVLSGSIINNRDAQNVLDANNVTVTEAGGATTVEWKPVEADSAIQSADVVREDLEHHKARFVWEWNSGTRRNDLEIDLWVRNRGKVS